MGCPGSLLVSLAAFVSWCHQNYLAPTKHRSPHTQTALATQFLLSQASCGFIIKVHTGLVMVVIVRHFVTVILVTYGLLNRFLC